jgi:hypothetical protein
MSAAMLHLPNRGHHTPISRPANQLSSITGTRARDPVDADMALARNRYTQSVSEPQRGDPVKKPRQHFVWQEYLRSWSTAGKLYCLQNGRVFATGTAVLGVGTDFYKVRSITDQDLTLLKLLAAREGMHPVEREFSEWFLDQVLSPTLFVSRHREQVQHVPELDRALDIHNTNVVDDYHTTVESSFVPLLARSLRGDISWYENDEHCTTFCQFIALQHLRTRRTKERVIARLKERMNVDLSRIWQLLAVIFGFKVGCSLFLERKGRTLVLVRN